MIQPELLQGQQWNIEVVKGRLSTRCFWNACKAFTVGMTLMVVGTAMATVGYYADQLSMAQETRGNTTVRFKNESRGFHLNNLSYAGPIVMGLGGFIVVAACVMTFEARDSAAKIVSAKPKQAAASAAAAAATSNGGTSADTAATATSATAARRQSSRRTAGVQTRNWNRNRSPVKRAATVTAAPHDAHRREMTASFLQFSRSLQRDLAAEASSSSPVHPILPPQRDGSHPVRSPSAPDLRLSPRSSFTSVGGTSRPGRTGHRDGHAQCGHSGSSRSGSRSHRRTGDMTRVSPLRNRRSAAAAALVLRQALSVDVPDACRYSRGSMELGASASACASVSVSIAGSQEFPLRSPPPKTHQRSLPLPLSPSPPPFAPLPVIPMTSSSSTCQPPTSATPPLMALRSDTARRHLLARQRPVDDLGGTSAAQVHAPPPSSR